MSNATPLLYRAAFRAWLVENTQEIVGYTGECFSCPLAVYVGAAKNQDSVEVNDEYCEINGQRLALPSWAKKFVEGVDDISEYASEEVWGARALAILDAIEER